MMLSYSACWLRVNTHDGDKSTQEMQGHGFFSVNGLSVITDAAMVNARQQITMIPTSDILCLNTLRFWEERCAVILH